MKTVDSTVMTYTYDGEGQRVRKDAAATSTEFIYFGDRIIAERNVTSGAWTDYIMAYGARIAKDTSINATGAQYFHADQIDSTRLVTNNTGAITWQATYNPFGQELDTQNTGIRFQFAGMEYDSEDNLNHTDFRQYASAEGRWLSPDPYSGSLSLGNPKSFNRYVYVLNNPLLMNDPNGLDCIYDVAAAKDAELPGPGVLRGDCQSDKDGGVFVDGTVTSASYNVDTGTATFRYRNFGNDTAGTAFWFEWQGSSPQPSWTPDDMIKAIRDKRQKTLDAAQRPLDLNANADLIFTMAYLESEHDLGCVGMSWATGSPGATLFKLGQPVPGSNPFVGEGTSIGTSPASSTLREALPQRLPFRVPTPVGGPGTGTPFRIAKTNSLGAAAGRYAPFAGAALTAFSVYQVTKCLNSGPQ